MKKSKSSEQDRRILVVDDDPAIVDSIQMLLEMEGYIVDTMTDGEKISKLKHPFPDLILLDIWMSGQDGRDISKYLKAKEDTKSIPIIIISAGREIAKSAKVAGADDFLAKPFEMDDLLSKVSKYVGKKTS